MPEREFDLYLSLLSRFLKLNPSQRGEISDELRTHLEDRLEELAARGLSREQAIHTALEELGDAAELAQHFTRAAHIRRRRLIMRCTYGTVAALVAALLIGTAFWPQTPQGVLPVTAVADDPAPPTQPEAAAVVEATKQPQSEADRIIATLNNPTKVRLVESPLEDAIRDLSKLHRINILLDRATLIDEGIALDTPVSFELDGVSFRSVLKLLLEPLQLTYVISDEVMRITTVTRAENMHEIRVYNVKDLLGSPDGKPIAEVVRATINPDRWIDVGGSGSIVEYNGLLLVRNTYPVHEDVGKLLEMMRQTLQHPEKNPAIRSVNAARSSAAQQPGILGAPAGGGAGLGGFGAGGLGGGGGFF